MRRSGNPAESGTSGRQGAIGAAVSCAVRLLSYRDRSEAELRDRLAKKGFPGEILEGAMERLKESGVIDDRRLAEAFARNAAESGALGLRGVRASLMKRRVPRDVVEDSLSGVEEDPAGAAALVRKRMGRLAGLPAETVRRRLRAFLSRRGFSLETIREAMRLSGVKEEE